MAETKYTQAQIDALIAADNSLERTAKDKYTDYKSKDPFPKVGEALLNSVDLLMYILTVGIVEPFYVDNLKGVTYACTFSGEAHRFDSETGGMKEINLNDNEELILEKNSITYLKIKEKFHVPEYMVLRFNLSVSNAYKGVLLGTGPIVDPGFEGSLFIPLHNLTGNKYIIKKGAPLIRVEFTKLSRHIDWNNKKINLFPQLKPITKKTPHNAKFSKFIENALLDPDEKKFYTSGDVVSVRSSIPDAIAESAKQATESAHYVKVLERWGIAGIIAVLVSIAAIFWGGYQLISDTNSRYDTMSQQISGYQSTNNQYQEKINSLQRRLTSLEIDDRQWRLNLLTDEYASIVDKNSDSAKKLNEQIKKLEEEIAGLQSQLP